MKNITRMMAGLTLALTLAACGGNPAPTPGSIELTATGVNASATVGSTTTGTFEFKNGGGSDLGYTVSVSYPTGKASGWLNFSGADASGTAKAGETKSVTVNVTCQPYADTYAATLTLLSKDGAISKQLPVTLNCTAETNIPENAPVLSVKAEASAVSTDSAHITGTASDNVQVQRVTYKLNGGAETTLTGVTAAKTITLDFKVPGLAEGNNEIMVTAYDTSNNATPRTLAVTYTAPVKPPTDTKAPTLTVPADQLTNADHYTISGSVSDEGGVKNVTYTVSKDGGPATAPAAATLSGSGYSLDLSGLTDGLYAVTITAQDNAGNQSAPQIVRLTVDRTAPSVSAGEVIVTDNLNGSAAVRVVAPDAASVSYSTDGATFQTVTGSSPFAFTVGTYAAGTHSVWVRATDAAGNVSAAVKYDFTIAPYGDLTAPVLTLQGMPLTNSSSVNVTGTVSDASPVTVTYALSGQATGSGTVTVNADGTFSINLSSLTDGVYTLTVTARDSNGNSTEKTTTVTVDQTAPSLQAGDVTVTDNQNGSATVTVGGVGENTLWYSLDGVTWLQATGSTFTVPASGVLGAGNYTVWVKVGDAAGNVSAPVSQSFSIARYGDLTAPTLALQPAQLTNAVNATVTGTVSDEGGVNGVSYTVSKDGGAASVVTGVTVTGGSFSIDLSGLTDGVYTLTVTAEDNNGNVQTAQTSVTVDQTAPGVDAGSIGVVDNQNGSATVTVGGVGENTLWYSLDGVTWLQATGSTFTVPASGVLGAGNYTVWVKVGDAAGNVSAPVSQSFSIARYGDLTAPSLDLQATAAFNAGSVSVTGTVSDASPVTVTYALSGQATGSGTVPVNADGTFGLDLSNLAEGSYTLTVTASDDNGNSTEKTATFTADRTAPEAGADQSDTEWRNTPFTAHFTATDALSGLSDAADADFDLTVSADAPNSTEPVQVTRVITDNVGNTRTVTASARIDTVAPTITATADRAPEWSGWYKDSVTVTFACDDALSGVADCSAPQTLKASGQAQGTVRDRAGNSSAASLDVNVDADAPTFSSDLSTSVVTVDGGSDALITGIIGDPSTQVQSLTYALNGAQPVDAAITPAASLALNLTVPNLQDGPNSIVLTATDALGHTSTKTLTVTAADTGAPTFTRVSIELVDPATTRTTLRLTGEVTDLVGVTRVTSSLNGGPETDLTITASQTVTFDQTLSGLIAGQNTLTVRAYDAAGNLETQSQSFDVTANDYLAPTISNLRAVGKGRSSNVGITASITDLAPVGAVAGVRKVTLEYIENGVVKRRDVTGSLTGTSFSYTTKTLMVGMQIKLIVEDNAGNTITSLTTILRR
ncbi:beta strand repeat-containing protein [Deinococcus ficus]|uniref:beta strand repeat-containing protein n=1 Tax=Deinococcus ficus TaxID=317577 RepID=UPI0003F823E7|nr:Ig-like domain-containing protein [Deinococcus ficus]